MELPPNKQTLHAILKGLIGAEIALGLISIPLLIFESVLVESMLTEAGMTQNISDSQMFSYSIAIMLLVVLLPMLIASWIGLFRLRAWSRWMYLGTVMSFYLLAIPLGCFEYQYHWGLSLAIMDFADPVTGIILGVIFLSPLAADFQNTKPDVPDNSS